MLSTCFDLRQNIAAMESLLLDENTSDVTVFYLTISTASIIFIS
jgi:hypothetical protein